MIRQKVCPLCDLVLGEDEVAELVDRGYIDPIAS